MNDDDSVDDSEDVAQPIAVDAPARFSSQHFDDILPPCDPSTVQVVLPPTPPPTPLPPPPAPPITDVVSTCREPRIRG